MKKGILITITAACALVGALIYADSAPPDREPPILHARLASPDVYDDGLYHAQIAVEAGPYEFRFVPNGDSPRNLDIAISDGDSALFTENFKLESTAHGPESARYYTWDYSGQKQLDLIEDYEVLEVQIDPRGDVLGPVTVFLHAVNSTS